MLCSNVVVTFDSVGKGLLIAIKQPFAVKEVDRKVCQLVDTLSMQCMYQIAFPFWVFARVGNFAGLGSHAFVI